jgi:hypothetical protein
MQDDYPDIGPILKISYFFICFVIAALFITGIILSIKNVMD